MSDTAQFDASLPRPYTENWREAYRADTGERPRMASYQTPDGEAIPFVQKSFRFSGGQSQDTAEYPFGGLWSTEYLNEKPQLLTVEGYLRGPAYITQRNNLIEALRVPTDDDHPGYIDLPFWGRFPVIVGDTYEVSESTTEHGQCTISLSFTRAGVSIIDRQDVLPATAVLLEHVLANLYIAAIDEFEARLIGNNVWGGGGTIGGDESDPDEGGGGEGGDEPDPDEGGGKDDNDEPDPNDTNDTAPQDNTTFASGFSQLKTQLLTFIGRIQGLRTTLDAMTGKVLGMIQLINQGIRSPRELAMALFNAGASIAGGILEIKNSLASG
ncbi:MAG: DNA circularization N-terminal domain-containing protein [Treponema sp.]|jgi:hypothetical protein|nr:DNA circularization N-terminal domain-containing protein [Treponema sp.]